MDIAPLEYIVIGLQDHQHIASELLPELNVIQENGLIRVIDLLFISKALDGTATIQEISQLSEEEQQPYTSLQENLTGLLTKQDVEHLAGEVAPGMVAVVVLLEHVWTISLVEAVRKAGGVLFTGGMVTPEALTQVSAELAAQASAEQPSTKEEHYA